jgi:hypothetical protein
VALEPPGLLHRALEIPVDLAGHLLLEARSRRPCWRQHRRSKSLY